MPDALQRDLACSPPWKLRIGTSTTHSLARDDLSSDGTTTEDEWKPSCSDYTKSLTHSQLNPNDSDMEIDSRRVTSYELEMQMLRQLTLSTRYTSCPSLLSR